MEAEFNSLVANALDFMERSIADLQGGTPKYSVINFYSGLELFLKARLLKEHWALCAAKVGQTARKSFAAGDFESISLEEAKARLSNIVGCDIPKKESEVYDRLRKRRNQAVHFYHPDDLGSERKVAVEQLAGWHFLYPPPHGHLERLLWALPGETERTPSRYFGPFRVLPINL